MNKNKIYFGSMLLLLLVIAVWAFYGLFHTGKKEEVHKVSVIVNNSSSDRWIPMRAGLLQAASDYGIDLNFVSAGVFQTAEEEIALMNRELENGAEGILVQMISSEEQTEELAEISARTALMLLETDVMPEDVYAFAGVDNAALGAALAEAIRSDFGDDLAGKTIGVLCGSQKQAAMRQRLEGFTESISDTKAVIEWIIDGTYDGKSGGDAMQRAGQVDIVAALENDETERMIDMLETKAREGLYGVGCSEKTVYYLDKGVLRALVVPNEFHMGYQSMKAIANQLCYRLAKAENCETEYLVVTRENLYEENNQKVLFPIVQ